MSSRYSAFDHFLGFAIIAAFLVVLYVFLPARWIEPWRIAHQFNVSKAQVHWEEKPVSCDYFRSPMGDKGCRFKISLTGYNSAGEPVAGDNAPLFREDPNSGQSLVSYDQGNSWHTPGRNTGTKVTFVMVKWVKVEN
jgi:hypothetical protein